jgi:hypothetical protein
MMLTKSEYQNKIIAETKIRKEIDNLYQINQNEITDYDVSTINISTI